MYIICCQSEEVPVIDPAINIKQAIFRPFAIQRKKVVIWDYSCKNDENDSTISVGQMSIMEQAMLITDSGL